MHMIRTGLFSLFVAAMVTPFAFGQDSVRDQLYGTGVHAYFSGRYADAESYLTGALDTGSRDPRVYYFRGLTRNSLGEFAAAKQDFELGARLEASNSSRFYRVSQALQRVQGSKRAEIEQYRTEGRLLALQRRTRMRRERYEQIREAEPSVLMEGVDDTPPSPAPATGDPFATPTDPPLPAEATEEMPGESNPLDNSVEPPVPTAPVEDMPAEEIDPFAEPADAPADDAPADDAPAEEMPVDDSDPFAEPADLPEADVPMDEPDSSPDEPSFDSPEDDSPADAPNEDVGADGPEDEPEAVEDAPSDEPDPGADEPEDSPEEDGPESDES